MVAGAAPPGENCIANGSVAIASVGSQGMLGTARLVSDQRGTGSFDDRPMVAAGQHGMVWVAWSQGPDADACQDVGAGDRIEVAVSHDAGRTFSDPVALPADGGHSAFGVRLAPLPGGQAAVSWTETTAAGDQAVLVSVLGTDGLPGQPEPVLTGDGPPLVLPGASFYDFPAGDITALPGGKLLVAAPFWVSGRSVIKLAAGTAGGRWQQTTLNPPPGADLLLPALGLLSPGDVRLLCAVHTRSGDRLGYDWAGVTMTSHGPAVSPAGLTALTPAPPGPASLRLARNWPSPAARTACSPRSWWLATAEPSSRPPRSARRLRPPSRRKPRACPRPRGPRQEWREHRDAPRQVLARPGPRTRGPADPPPRLRGWPRRRWAAQP